MYRKSLLAAVRSLVVGLLLVSTSSFADTWPSKPLTVISTFSAGGITDALSRIMAEHLAKNLGQTVVVENRTGAGGSIALNYVAKGPAEGYLLVMGGASPSAIVPALNPGVGYHPVRDFEAIGLVADLPLVLVLHPSIPARNLQEFIAYAKANPNKLNCASHGEGSLLHLACIQFDRMAGTRMVHVPYRGAAQVNPDLLAGRVQVYFGTLPTQLPFIKSGQQKAIAIATRERVASVPDIPTVSEAGLKGYEISGWNALYVAAGTPKPVVDRLVAEVKSILASPEVQKKIEATGSIMRPLVGEELRRFTAQEFEGYRKLATEANIKLAP